MIKRPFCWAFLMLIFFQVGYSQSDKKCCDQPACRQKTLELAKRITGLVNYLGTCSDDAAVNNARLKDLEANSPNVYQDFMQTAKTIADEYIDHPKYSDSRVCFFNTLPAGHASNVLAWINFIRPMNPKFPSTEFCGGLSRRFEIGQGASAFLNENYMKYLGAVRGFLVYTFHPKKSCGGNFRLMAGPAYFLRSSDSYLALSSRLGIRIKDLKATVFNLGNINFFGGYTSNFNHFNYAEAGFEIELGAFGVNIAANYDTDIKKAGFLIGLVLANKKL